MFILSKKKMKPYLRNLFPDLALSRFRSQLTAYHIRDNWAAADSPNWQGMGTTGFKTKHIS